MHGANVAFEIAISKKGGHIGQFWRGHKIGSFDPVITMNKLKCHGLALISAMVVIIQNSDLGWHMNHGWAPNKTQRINFWHDLRPAESNSDYSRMDGQRPWLHAEPECIGSLLAELEQSRRHRRLQHDEGQHLDEIRLSKFCPSLNGIQVSVFYLKNKSWTLLRATAAAARGFNSNGFPFARRSRPPPPRPAPRARRPRPRLAPAYTRAAEPLSLTHFLLYG